MRKLHEIANFNQGTPHSLDIHLVDGREVRIVFDPDKDRIKIIYHSHEWNWKECEFSNFQYPSD